MDPFGSDALDELFAKANALPPEERAVYLSDYLDRCGYTRRKAPSADAPSYADLVTGSTFDARADLDARWAALPPAAAEAGRLVVSLHEWAVLSALEDFRSTGAVVLADSLHALGKRLWTKIPLIRATDVRGQARHRHLIDLIQRANAAIWR